MTPPLETALTLAAPMASFASSAVATRWLASRPGAMSGLIDRPNARSLHGTPVPRGGGLAAILGFGSSWGLLTLWGLGAPELAWVAGAALPVAGVSLLDDFGHVSRRLRLGVHLGAALILIAGGLAWSVLDFPGTGWPLPLPLPLPLAWALTLLFVVWMANLYNFMDGMDGFAGGMTLFGFAALAVLGWRGADLPFALAAACVAAAAGGFLTCNFPPARIFLGDVGSSTLGLIAAGLSLWGTHRGLFPLWAAWLAFSPFIVDATWTLLARLVRRERIWEAHRCHHYQRLVLAGWGHRKTVLRSYAVMAGAAACAVAAPDLTAQDQWTLLAGWAAIYGLIHWRVGLAERVAATDRR
jgi:UDP-N-acetylmuramyl pentapeptide phosphotransferase/UDP-N-acetylglucosamine-1-phosphate transferase